MKVCGDCMDNELKDNQNINENKDKINFLSREWVNNDLIDDKTKDYLLLLESKAVEFEKQKELIKSLNSQIIQLKKEINDKDKEIINTLKQEMESSKVTEEYIAKMIDLTALVNELTRENNDLRDFNNDLIRANNELSEGIYSSKAQNYYFDMFEGKQRLDDWSWYKMGKSIEIDPEVLIENDVRTIGATQTGGRGTYRYVLDEKISGDFEISMQIKRLNLGSLRLSFIENLDYSLKPRDTRFFLNNPDWCDYIVIRKGNDLSIKRKLIDGYSWTTVKQEKTEGLIEDSDCYLNFLFYFKKNENVTKSLQIRNLKIVKF